MFNPINTILSIYLYILSKVENLPGKGVIYHLGQLTSPVYFQAAIKFRQYTPKHIRIGLQHFQIDAQHSVILMQVYT